MEAVRARIRDVPDFTKKGIVFKDITPVLQDRKLFRQVIDAFVARWKDERIDKIVGIESRGFLFAAPLAYALGAGLTIVRKPGKLPWDVISEAYALEYGEASLELHVDAVGPGERVLVVDAVGPGEHVLVVDDVLATGGTAEAVGRLVTRQGATLVSYSFLVELSFLSGARRLGPGKVHALISY